MRSKTLKQFSHILFLITLVLGINQCSYFFDEKQVETEVNFDDQVGGCLSSANTVLSSFFDGERADVVTEQNIDRTVECYQEAITSFNKNTTSGRSGVRGYTPDIFHNFITEFYSNINLSLLQVTEYVKIKGFLIGGTTDTFTKEELEVIKDIIPQVGELLKKILPHRQVLLQKESLERTPEDYARFKEAFAVFKGEVGTLLVTLNDYRGHRSISMEDVLSFIFKEMFFDSYEDKMKMIPLVVAFKNMALDDTGGDLYRNNLSFFVRQGIVTYEAIAQFEYFVKGQDEKSIFTNIGHVASFLTRIPSFLHDSSQLKTVSLEAVADMVQMAEVVLTYAIQTREDQKIPYYKIHDLIMALDTAGLMTGSLSSSTLSVFIEDLSEKWFDPNNQGDAALTRNKVIYLKQMFGKWMERQRLANELSELSPGDTVSLVELESPYAENPLMVQWTNALKEISLHQWDDSNRVLFSQNMTQFTYNEMTVSNSLFLLVEVFMKPFNVDKSNPNNFAITEAEAQEIYEVLRILGVEMAFMDSRVYDSGNKAFLEGNNFSTQMQNDADMDFYEGYEYVTVALNSGQLADKIYEDIPDSCHLEDYTDVHHRPVTEKQCFKSFLFDNYGRFFDHLPIIRDFWAEADAQTRRDYLQSMEYASRAGVLTGKPYDLGEIRFIVSVTYYIQSVFALFDRESPYGIAKGEELNRAEEHFRSMIAELIREKRPTLIPDNRNLFEGRCGSKWSATGSDELSDEEISHCIARKLFIHLLGGGSIPSGGLDLETASFATLLLQFMENRAYNNTEANAHDVLKVFSALAQVNRDSHIDLIKRTLIERHEPLVASLGSDQSPECLAIAKNLRSQGSGINQAIESGEIPSDLDANEVFFCYWVRKLYCNESVTEPIYDYFRDNRYNLFTGEAWQLEDKTIAAERSMGQMYSTFRMHRLFSTQCAFPVIEEDTFPDRSIDSVTSNHKRRLDFHKKRHQ